MKKLVSIAFIMLLTGLSSGRAWAGDIIKSEHQARVASAYFEENMQVYIGGTWRICSNFRNTWQEGFKQANADLEASFAYYATASDQFIRTHRAAFELVNSIAHHYLHNNCPAIPGAFEIVDKSNQFNERSQIAANSPARQLN
ncbi:hypothetical protein FE236_02515 [Mariprofundus erugo]|uniref:Uncharacterized protein n=1 Tax=Mariprofundus erugo TaxID=2528639 RepID=A0A5R9GR87_9PROT|nr:hypothetical protein [Mariprofundus erugo]TLS65704.1 hypothetical protein FEF65_12065 [Mariprofundus erugo]TLS77981.1 hypothetical protein FE236_02515 [Mariprofundus erugo]